MIFVAGSKSSSNRGAFTVATKVVTDRMALDRHLTEMKTAWNNDQHGHVDEPQASVSKAEPVESLVIIVVVVAHTLSQFDGNLRRRCYVIQSVKAALSS